ncbi:MAG: hypothetical protein WA775_02935 [Psychroserpens sp.]|uniref:hypothetical protein n=1 Tax=Psychroserpens sp. TaxID=2020870 RepID=UPI003CA5C200
MEKLDQKASEAFGNAIGNLLVNCGAINFKMNLEESHIHIDFDKDKTDNGKIRSAANDINELAEFYER